MKSIISRTLLCFLLSAVYISCNNDNPEQTISFSLDKPEIEFDSSGGELKIKVTANCDWSAENIPDWISLDHASGNTDMEITITAKANEQTEKRDVKIVFVNEYKDTELYVSQAAQAVEELELKWSALAFSQYSSVELVSKDNVTGNVYSFSTQQMFVNPDLVTNMGSKIFLGNLVNRKLDAGTNITEYTGYTFNPITVVPLSTRVESRTFIPSRTEQDAYAKEVIEKEPNQQGQLFIDGKGVEYRSHRELSLIGLGNMGVRLDEIVAGKSYREQEMVKKTGIIYSFSQTLFTFTMELQEFIVKEKIDKANFPDHGLSYIPTVSYGRIGLLIIESDHSAAQIRGVANKIFANKSNELTEDDLAILDEISAFHIYFDASQKLTVTKGKADAFEAYVNQIINDVYNVFPFKMTIADYFDHSITPMTFRITI